jgi:hypothetical protein
MNNEPKITLRRPGKPPLEIPLTTLTWNLWCCITYPLAIVAGYIIFGLEGALYTTALLILTNRGRL